MGAAGTSTVNRQAMKLNRSSLISMVGNVVTAILLGFVVQPAFAQVDFDREPINYSSAPANDAVARLQQRIDAGKVQLAFDQRHGYLPSVLEELGISEASQLLVFSKTSLQLGRISPWTPRALYFNDQSYVGWVQYGEVMEVSAVDPHQGAIFYTLRQELTERPQFVRDKGDCLTCHASFRTQGVPGYFVRSVFPAPSGLPHFGAGTFNTDQTSPLKERWGGWHVTGTHGQQRHMGNVVSEDRDHPEVLDIEGGANVTDLEGRTHINAYLTRHSDIVALMVLGHQATMHNMITLASFEARAVQHYTTSMNRALERPSNYVSESSRRRIQKTGEKLFKYMLFVDEADLRATIKGSSDFAEEFSACGPHDKNGRSLRQLDLESRLLKYPCSYLVYSDSFNAVPEEVKHYVYRRLWEVLKNEDQSKEFSHLSAGDRKVIFEILRDTKPDLATFWKTHFSAR